MLFAFFGFSQRIAKYQNNFNAIFAAQMKCLCDPIGWADIELNLVRCSFVIHMNRIFWLSAENPIFHATFANDPHMIIDYTNWFANIPNILRAAHWKFQIGDCSSFIMSQVYLNQTTILHNAKLFHSTPSFPKLFVIKNWLNIIMRGKRRLHCSVNCVNEDRKKREE